MGKEGDVQEWRVVVRVQSIEGQSVGSMGKEALLGILILSYRYFTLTLTGLILTKIYYNFLTECIYYFIIYIFIYLFCVCIRMLTVPNSFSYQERVRVPGHLSSCECSPEVALKIQFLRLVHSFCDQSDYRVSV